MSYMTIINNRSIIERNRPRNENLREKRHPTLDFFAITLPDT